MAGVKTIIMSLWKVDDKATSEMMQLFYSKWLGGMEKREAFRLAQQELKKKYKKPYYWAGFVMLD
ncbi:MAG: CHAT domain-containing protein [Bacteroidota bacterium]|nr:CHAT domain-containing protein [Bacteroidota bacterium]MDP3434688.1 CHAT domain-containing protein [Bacteroidota bacterium]